MADADCLPRWHSKPRKLRVIHVGAGATGLLMAYKMKKNMTNYELLCYDKNSDVGGTWFENRYPGCACDVPAHAYTYSFEPNPNWSTYYAYGPEILKYFQDFAAKYELMPFIRLNSRVKKASWTEEHGIYEIEVEREGKIIKDWCDILVNGTGFLNNWKWPAVPGLHDFKGELLHSAAWDTRVEWKDKTVAVIGTGSSAIQIVPQIQKTAAHLTSFMRSTTWISPPVAGNLIPDKVGGQRGMENPAANPQDPKPTPRGQYRYSEEDKARFRDDPDYHLQYRQQIESEVNLLFGIFIKDSGLNKAAHKQMEDEMRRRLGPGQEDLGAKLVPSWPPGCRRLTPGEGYLEALVQPNVTTVHCDISKVVPEGIVDATGKLHKADILVCATGFNLAFAPPFDLSGVDGVKMADEFEPEPRVYLSVAVPKFPNYFIVNGVRGNWAAGSALPSHEVCVEYILQCIRKIQQENIKALEVKSKPIDQLYKYIDKWHEGSVFSENCKSWYKNNIPGGRLWIWGGSALHFLKTMKEVKFEHYNISYRDENMWAYLGNGFVEAEVKQDRDSLAPYVRNGDNPWVVG